MLCNRKKSQFPWVTFSSLGALDEMQKYGGPYMEQNIILQSS